MIRHLLTHSSFRHESLSMLAAKICRIMPTPAPVYGCSLGHSLTTWPVTQNISSQAIGRLKPALLALLAFGARMHNFAQIILPSIILLYLGLANQPCTSCICNETPSPPCHSHHLSLRLKSSATCMTHKLYTNM